MPRMIAVGGIAMGLWAQGAVPVVSSEPVGSRPPIVSAAAEWIAVDAVVSDAQGRPVTGLSADDFVLEEDGVAQALTSLDEFKRPPVPLEPGNAGAEAPPAAPGP